MVQQGRPVDRDDAGYRKLAMCVIARAVVDCHLPARTRHDRNTYHLHTAQALLSRATHPVLTFWCQWLDLDPSQVSRAYASGTLLSPQIGRQQYRSETPVPYRRR